MKLVKGSVYKIKANSGDWEFIENTVPKFGKFRNISSNFVGIFPIECVIESNVIFATTKDVEEISTKKFKKRGRKKTK